MTPPLLHGGFDEGLDWYQHPTRTRQGREIIISDNPAGMISDKGWRGAGLGGGVGVTDMDLEVRDVSVGMGSSRVRSIGLEVRVWVREGWGSGFGIA